jgi:O-antigen/teichoic acid export membrane protein
VTGLSLLAISGTAAAVGAILAQKFGRTAQTDGFLAAYGVYLVLVLAAQSFRLVVLPELTRAAREGKLGPETRAYLASFTALAIAASLLVVVLRHPLGAAITGSLPEESSRVAARALVYLVPAAFGQLLAALAASALAARDEYEIAAGGYAAGGIAGLVLFVLLADAHGPIALAWATGLNSTLTFGIPFAALFLRGDLRGHGARLDAPRRLWRLVEGSAVPIAIQGLYLVCLRFAADLGVGKVTSLSYAYLIAAVFVAVTAASVALVSSAPLTRRGLDAETAAAHVVHASWLSLALIAAAAGVFALVGGRVVEAVLGDAFSGDVGRQLGRLVVYLVPWMFASVAYTLAFPLVFVVGRHRRLVPIALCAIAVHVPLAFVLSRAFEMPGIALSLAISTLLVLGVLLLSLSPRVLTLAVRGLGRLALVEAGLAAVSFGLLALLLGGIPAAVVGLVVYALLLAAWRPRGLREAWAYVRALH